MGEILLLEDVFDRVRADRLPYALLGLKNQVNFEDTLYDLFFHYKQIEPARLGITHNYAVIPVLPYLNPEDTDTAKASMADLYRQFREMGLVLDRFAIRDRNPKSHVEGKSLKFFKLTDVTCGIVIRPIEEYLIRTEDDFKPHVSDLARFKKCLSEHRQMIDYF